MHIKKVSYLIIVGIYMMLMAPLYSQVSSPYKNITTSDGLSQGMVHDILQDQKGFMWFGTKDGLNRYDGYQFEIFTNDLDNPLSIAGNSVTKLFEDSKGRIWVAIANIGLDIFDPNTGRFHHIKYNKDDPKGISGSHVINILEDTTGYFILNVDAKEINLIDVAPLFESESQQPIVVRIDLPIKPTGTNMPATILKGITKDTKGRIWAGGIDEMYLLDVKKANLISYGIGYSVGQTLNNDDGSFWSVGNFESLFYWDGKKGNRANGAITEVKLRSDSKGRTWILSYNAVNGYNIDESILPPSTDSLHEKMFFHWKPDFKKYNYPFNSITIDHADNIWVGTNGYGIYRINANQTKFEHRLLGVSVYNITIAGEYPKYIRTFHGWYNEGNDFVGDYPISNDENTYHLENILTCKNGDFLIKHNELLKNIYQVCRVSPEGKVLKKYDIPWMHYDSQPLIEANDGKMWIAGFDQIVTCILPDNGKTISYDLNTGSIVDIKNEDKIQTRKSSTAIYEDTSGDIWVGTKSGMYRYTYTPSSHLKLNVTKYKNENGDKNSLSYNHVMAFLDDPILPKRYLWICTKGGGINRLDKADNTFLRLSKDDGLPDDVVYGVLADDNGNIWGSTNKGLFCLLRSGLEKEEYNFKNFSKSDGLQEEEFNTGSFAKLPDGRLIFGGVNGYNIFDPNDVLDEKIDPQVHITDLKINNNKILPYDESNILKGSMLHTDAVTLQPHHEILTITFAALDYTDPLRNKYRYKMEGLDDTWIMSGNQRSATFVQLVPGDYQFTVEGTDSHGVWSGHSDTLTVKVLPPWYQTWWAYMTYIVLALTLAYLLFRIYDKRQKLSQALAFEKRESDRVRELEYQKSQLFMNMTHEFRTPLTIILGKAKLMQTHVHERTKVGIDMIIRNGEHLLGMVNNMLDISKLDSGKLTLNLTNNDIVKQLENKLSSFQFILKEKNIQLHYLPEVSTLTHQYDIQKVNHVITNLISNAIKFTNENGHIYVMLSVSDSDILIKVKDTGSGISPDAIPCIFDRFYQEDNSITRKSEGSGIGLALTKELIILMQGSIKVYSPPPGASMGSEFVVSLPRDAQELLKSELAASDNRTNTNPVEIRDQEIHAKTAANTPVEMQNTKVFENNKSLIILIVEDNADVRDYILSCISTSPLLNDQNIKIEMAANGQIGMEKAIKIVPDLIISDVMMPVMDGFDMTNRLNKNTATDHIPCIFLTARADVNSRLEGLELGANSYLPKPFEPQELVLTIKNIITYRDKVQARIRHNLQTHPHEEEKLVDSSNHQIAVSEDKFVVQVKSIIKEGISDVDFSVKDISQAIHLSHSQLARKLNALTGYTPSQFIKKIRLNHALWLLEDETNSITAIAYDCGFNDPGYFIKVFKKEYGVTPGHWKGRVTP